MLLQYNCYFPGSRHRRVLGAPCCREAETSAVLAQRAYATTWPSPAEHCEQNGRSSRLLGLTWPAPVRAQMATATIVYHCNGLPLLACVCCRDQATADVWWCGNAGDVYDIGTNLCPNMENLDTASVGDRSSIGTTFTLYLLFICRSPAANLRYACRPPTSCLVHRRRKRCCQGPSRMEGILATYARSPEGARQPPAAALRCDPRPCRTSHTCSKTSRN